jgi:hypothetical protein
MCTVQLQPGGNPIAVNKYIISKSTISEIGGRLGVSYGTCQRAGREALEHAEDLDVNASAAQRQEEALASQLCYPHLPQITTYDFLLFPKMKS